MERQGGCSAVNGKAGGCPLWKAGGGGLSAARAALTSAAAWEVMGDHGDHGRSWEIMGAHICCCVAARAVPRRTTSSRIIVYAAWSTAWAGSGARSFSERESSCEWEV